MIEWLEDYFSGQALSLMMVTHDRYFLDRVCNQILELDQGQLFEYAGNYQSYLREKENRETIAAVTAKKTRSLYRKELEWMRRQPKARTTKSKSRIEDFQQLKHKALDRRKQREMELEINMERLGTKVIELHNLCKAYGDNLLIDGFSYSFKRGERIGLIGPNGSGKSTFLNMVAGQLSPDQGKVVHGETVKIGYYTQQGLSADPGMKVIDAVREFGDYIPLKKGRQLSAQQLLERFLFDRKQQYDYIEKLSGGERKRLFLCTVLIQNPNFLILDEPTNDLDILTLAVLEAFLQDFPGTLLIVSHDRFFMDKITDHLFILEGNGRVRDFPGNYTDYRTYGFPETTGETTEASKQVAEKPRGSGARKGKRNYTQQQEFDSLESAIARLETRKSEIETLFSETQLPGKQMDELSIELAEVIAQLEAKTERWFELASIEEEDS
jgi:ATP-binding cassette subfamily F protein uup